MLERFAQFVARRSTWIVIVSLVLCVGAAIYGLGVARALAAGGFEVRDGEASRVAEVAAERFGQGEPDIVALVRHEELAANDPDVRAQLAELVSMLSTHPDVSAVESPLGPAGDALVSKDGTTAMIAISVHGDASEKEGAYDGIADVLHGCCAGLQVELGGSLAMAVVGQKTAEHDLRRAELVAFPVVGLILLAFFRGRIATLLPLAVGALSIAFATAVLRGLAQVTHISIFALNIVTLLGLGLAIDYSLYVVQRFREELPTSTPQAAAVATVMTAGKTMLFSGLAVAVSLLGLFAFPVALLHSIALSGAIIVVLTVLAALVVLPALLVMLGRRIDWPRSHTLPVAVRPGRAWARIAEWVMRRPGMVAVGTAILLLAMGAPVLRMQTGLSDARMFPPDSEVRQVQRTLDADEGFAAAGTVRYVIVLEADAPIWDAAVLGDLYDTHAALVAAPEVRKVDDLVSALRQSERERFIVAGEVLGPSPTPPPGLDQLVDGDATLVTVVADAPTDSSSRAAQIERLREIAGEHFTVQIGGRAKVASEVDHELARGLVPALVIVIVVTLVVLTLAFGAIVVAIKAVLMNVLSLSASFGALVWVFQDGRFEGLLDYEASGAIDPLVLVIMFAIVFGLSMDYELFLLSRIREDFDETQDPRGSVARGLAATGRLITMAALMLIVVLLGFGTGHILFVKQLGIGMALAVAVDATIVRALLVPATMRLLGRSNWWAPRWFERWWQASGIGVREGTPGVPPVSHKSVPHESTPHESL
jgi:RND superfamily putative drug exporter